MAKGIRSKSKRRNRAEFRNTIGQQAADKSMATVQEKLQACIDKGSMNSFERLSKIFGNTDDDDNNNDTAMQNGGVVATVEIIDDSPSTKKSKPLLGKTPDKLAPKKKEIMKKSKIRGQKKGVRVMLRASTKKRKSSGGKMES